MAVYTKKGDKGKTSLYLYNSTGASNKRVDKDIVRIRAIGEIDELNSFIGIILSLKSEVYLYKALREIQEDLFTIGSILAGAKLNFPASKTRNLEKKIDKIEAKLPVLTGFIFPGGDLVAAHLHFARTLARRAERSIVSLNKKETVSPEILSFINRLSDFLFILAREENLKRGFQENIWRGIKKT